MEITEELVRHVGKIARINLSDTEVQQFKKDFKDILDHFSVLAQAQADCEPAFHPVNIVDSIREDIIDAGPSDSLAPVADIEDGYIRGPKIV